MLIPNGKGEYFYRDQRVVDYHAMVDIHNRVIEVFTTEDGEKYVGENEWTEMNDIEKYFCRQHGWDLDKCYPD